QAGGTARRVRPAYQSQGLKSRRASVAVLGDRLFRLADALLALLLAETTRCAIFVGDPHARVVAQLGQVVAGGLAVLLAFRFLPGDLPADLLVGGLLLGVFLAARGGGGRHRADLRHLGVDLLGGLALG